MGRKHTDAHKKHERNNDIHDATCLVWHHFTRVSVSEVFRPVQKMVSRGTPIPLPSVSRRTGGRLGAGCWMTATSRSLCDRGDVCTPSHMFDSYLAKWDLVPDGK